jgi:hypothetical protein
MFTPSPALATPKKAIPCCGAPHSRAPLKVKSRPNQRAEAGRTLSPSNFKARTMRPNGKSWPLRGANQIK